MNDLIKELAEKAGIEIEIDDYGEVRLSTAYGSSLEYFAKLVMQESASACSSFDCGRTKSAEDLINQHFKIE